MNVAIKVFPDTYVDSVAQLGAIRAMREVDGVDWASAAMGTPANVEILRERGVDPNRSTNRRLSPNPPLANIHRARVTRGGATSCATAPP